LTTHVLCAWCEAERRSVPLTDLERFDDESGLGGMCWTHALRKLVASRPGPGTAGRDDRRFLVVVERKSEALFVRLSELLLDDPRIQVMLDRRQRERRARDVRPVMDRRRDSRRALPDYWADLRHHPVVVRPTTLMPDPVPSADKESHVMASAEPVTQPRQRLDEWMRQGSQLISRVLDENELLQQRVRAAEAHAEKVTETVQDLEREVNRLRAEIEEFKAQRGQVVDAVQSWVGEMGRLTTELLAKTRRA